MPWTKRCHGPKNAMVDRVGGNPDRPSCERRKTRLRKKNQVSPPVPNPPCSQPPVACRLRKARRERVGQGIVGPFFCLLFVFPLSGWKHSPPGGGGVGWKEANGRKKKSGSSCPCRAKCQSTTMDQLSLSFVSWSPRSVNWVLSLLSLPPPLPYAHRNVPPHLGAWSPVCLFLERARQRWKLPLPEKANLEFGLSPSHPWPSNLSPPWMCGHACVLVYVRVCCAVCLAR